MESFSREVQSIAERNQEKAAAEAENVYITKEDAAEEQSYESHMLGGRIPKGSLAAQMQVGSDHHRHVWLYLSPLRNFWFFS